MPKAPPQSTPSKATKESNPHVLKRHQACHQCRKRKMKCDAKRPCSSCVRSHAYALMHAAPGTQLPGSPECTFDEVAELVYNEDDEREERYVALESRIMELETLLQNGVPDGTVSKSSSPQAQRAPDQTSPPSGVTLRSSSILQTLSRHSPDSGDNWASNGTGNRDNTSSALLVGPFQIATAEGSEVAFPSWPRSLPPPSVLRHLAEAFFAFHIHAHHLLHAPTFMASLSYPPHHPQFPIPALLHAVCAIGSCYASLDSSKWSSSCGIGNQKDRPNFSNQQAQYAKRLADDNIGFGHNLLQHLQVNILLSWYYWLQARWVEVYTRVASTLRIAVSLGLNLAPQFACISNSMRPTSLIPPATTILEDEMRRNAFWIAYALERQYGSSNGWALSLDDQDVFQLLPLRSDQYDSGVAFDVGDRQFSQSHDVLLVHLENQTDSFILYIKAAMLLSRVKNFNLRTRAKYLAEDPSLPQQFSITDVRFDPRETPEFGAMNSITLAFTDSLPNHFKDPMPGGVVDPFIYSTLMAPSVALILLHEPYAMVGKDSCLSAYHILSSARSIAGLIHMLTSTSYDCAKLGLFPVFAWFTSARVLTRFLRTAQEEKYSEQIHILEGEVSFTLSVLQKLGGRIPIAQRYAKMLEDHITKTCGTDVAARLCFSEPSDATGFVFSPEMHEGDTADKLLAMRLASLGAIVASGQQFTPPLARWPVSDAGVASTPRE